jgi:hypothetical protein
VSRLKSGMDHCGEVGADGVGIDGVLQPGRERRHHAVGVVAGPVEPPVHGVLHPPPDRTATMPRAILQTLEDPTRTLMKPDPTR